MTKIQEIAAIDAELAMLERDLKREKEYQEALDARLSLIQAKIGKLLGRLDAVRDSTWD